MRNAFPAERPDARCARIAAGQHGAIHRGQALAAGLSPSGMSRRCRAGLWHRALPCVYVIAAFPCTWLQSCYVASLWAGAHAAIGYQAAAALLGLVERDVNVVDVVSTRALKSPNRTVVVHRPRLLTAGDVTYAQGLRVTTATRTLLDWAALAAEETLEEALDVALRRRLTSIERLRWQLDREASKGRDGVGQLRRVVDHRGEAVPESVLETRFRRLVRQFALPAPVSQYPVRDGCRFIARVDFAYPRQKLAVEVDGYRYHSGRRAWANDLARGNDLVGLGWSVLRFTWDDVNRAPEKVARALEQALRPSSP